MSDFDVLHRYTRQDALDDGVLVDVTAMAKEAGIVIPTALTAAVWGRCVGVPDGVEMQDEQGRLWDVLWMFRMAGRNVKGNAVRFGVHVRNDDEEGEPPLVSLLAVCGPGDSGEPVITIMMPDES